MKLIQHYQSSSGSEPFRDWIEKLDPTTRVKILAYIKRLQIGAAKNNVKPVGQGVFELKIDFGPGYRVYFAETSKREIILLLLGGHKKSQDRDIRQAQLFWRHYGSQQKF
jgi:putative addiction module killer protein